MPLGCFRASSCVCGTTRGKGPETSVGSSAIAGKYLQFTQPARASRLKPKLLLFHVRCFRNRCMRDSGVPVWGRSCRTGCIYFSCDRQAPLLPSWGCVSAALYGLPQSLTIKRLAKALPLALTLHPPLGTETITQNIKKMPFLFALTVHPGTMHPGTNSLAVLMS